MKTHKTEAQEWMDLARSHGEEEQLTQADKMLQGIAENLPPVKMEEGDFERIWENITATL